MREEDEIEQVIRNLPSETKYRGMTYEEGIRDALEWVLGNLDDDEFDYAPK
jgi:hypothetical protein